MRTISQNVQISISDLRGTCSAAVKRPVLATVILVIAMMNAPAAWSDTERLDDHGRRSQTGPKGPQAELDGFPIVEVSKSPTETGYSVDDTGRQLRAGPTQPISVGLVGCPGCTVVLEAIGGLYLEVDGHRRRPTSEHGHRPIRSKTNQ